MEKRCITAFNDLTKTNTKKEKEKHNSIFIHLFAKQTH